LSYFLNYISQHNKIVNYAFYLQHIIIFIAMRKILLLLFLSCATIYAQDDIPKDYFAKPLDVPIILSGNFGELRSNHFHSGLDIKTEQKEGLPVLAAADGYVSRIKVDHYGYGKALYVVHPNGYTTVYAHLQRYANDVQSFVKEKQYARETFELELFPDKEQLLVKKGDIIAYSGNSGSSGGPHLHFEIRDASERPMNPMLFGIDVGDSKKPLINSILAYPVGEEAAVNRSQNPIRLKLILQKDGNYKTENLTTIGKIGFGLSAYDQQNGASNKNGVYQINTTYNGEEKFNILFEKFSFDETRYLNRFIDYGYWIKNKSRVQKLFREENNPLSIIKNEDNDGFINVKEGLQSVFKIEVCDFQGNKVLISIPIEGKIEEINDTKKIKETEDYIIANQATSITKGKYSIYIPAGSLYEDMYLNIKVDGDTLVFDKDEIPIHKNITISYDASNYKEEDLENVYIGRLNWRKDAYYNSTYRNGSKLSTKIRTFGTYVIAADTKPPSIKALNLTDRKWISDNKTIQFRIDDNNSGIASYRATVNGKFILMEYDYKTNLLTYDFSDGIITDTENNLKLIVIDNAGNTTTFEATFFRNQS